MAYFQASTHTLNMKAGFHNLYTCQQIAMARKTQSIECLLAGKWFASRAIAFAACEKVVWYPIFEPNAIEEIIY